MGTCIPHPTLLPGCSCVNILLYYHLICNMKHTEGYWLQSGGQKYQICSAGGKCADHSFNISAKQRWNYISCCRHAVRFTNRPERIQSSSSEHSVTVSHSVNNVKTRTSSWVANYPGAQITDANIMVLY